MIETKQYRGKQRKTWTSDVTDWDGMGCMKCVIEWRKVERTGDPWHQTFCEVDCTNSDS